METTVFTPQQIANMLNISLGLVYKEIERGSIRAIKLGRIYRIPLKEKERIVAISKHAGHTKEAFTREWYGHEFQETSEKLAGRFDTIMADAGVALAKL